MQITPYSALATPAQLAATAANFPALKHFFPCNEANGATSIADIVGGLVVTAAVVNPGANPNTIKFSAGILPITAGTLVDYTLAGKTTILMILGRFAATSGFSIGASVSSGARMSVITSVTGSTMSDGTNSTSATLSAAAVVAGCGLALAYPTGGTVTGYYAVNTAAGVATTVAGSAPTPGALTGANFNIAQEFSNSSSSACSYSGIMIWQFNTATAPTDIPAALAWMAAQSAAGNDVGYPGWKGLS